MSCGEAELPDVADDADDGTTRPRRGVHWAGGDRQRDLLSDRIGAVPVLRHRLVDHHHAHRFFGVEIGEDAAAHHRHADGGEVLRRRDADVRRRTPLRIVDDAALDVEPRRARRAAAERHRIGDRRGVHAGLRLQPLEHRQVELPLRVDVRIAREVAEDLRRQHAVRSITGLDALQPVEAGEQQAGADQQHHRHRHLRDDQRALHPLAAAGVAGLAAALLQRRRRDRRGCRAPAACRTARR